MPRGGWPPSCRNCDTTDHAQNDCPWPRVRLSEHMHDKVIAMASELGISPREMLERILERVRF